jgi:PAS domain S-box-containing protein
MSKDGVYLDFHAKDPSELLVPPEQFLGKNMREVLPPEITVPAARCIEQAAESGDTCLFEYSLPSSGGDRYYEARMVSCDTDKVLSIVRDISERKRAEQARRESEERFSKAFHSSPQPMSITTLEEGRYVDVNDRFLEVSGYTREEVIGRTSFDLNIWESKEARDEIARPAKERGQVRNVETKFRAKGGEFRVLLSSVELMELDGRQCLLFASSDITERKQAEAANLRRAALRADVNAALAEREGSLQSILQQCAEAVVRHKDAAFARIWTLNHKEGVLELQASAGLYTHLNGRHSRVPVGELKIGLIAEQRQPLLTNDVCNDPRVNDREWAREQGMAAFAGYPLLVEDRVVGVMAMFARHQLTEGTVEALATIAAPIAQGIERKRAEQALGESEERFRSAFDHATIGMALVAPDGRFLQVNHSACELFGYSEPELLATDFQSLTHPDDLDLNLAYRRQILAGEIPAYQMEKRYIHKRGHTVWGLLSVSLLRDAAGQPLYFISQVQDITERKLAGEKLRESEERFRQLAENIGAAFFLTEEFSETSPGRVVYVSPAYEKIWGRSRQSLYQDTRSWLDAVHSEDRERVLAALRSVGQAQFDEEFRIVRPDGEVRWVHDRVFPIRDERGEVYRLAGIVEDVTERKQMEEALIESQLRHSLATAAGGVGVWDWNLETGEIYIDPMLKDILGFENHEIENRIDDWRRRVHPEDADRVTAEAQSHIEGLTPGYEVEHRMLHKDGSVRWFLARGTIIQFKNGQPCRMVGTDTDITERKQAEEALRESEERARRTLVEQMLAGVAECDANKKFVLVNQRFCDITGYTEAELLEMRVDDITHPDDLPGTTQLHQRLVETGESFVVEKRYRRKDGSEVWVNANVSPIRSGRSRDEEAVAVVIDITGRKRAEREREQLLKGAQAANRSKDEFLAVVSHELRSPLNAILGYTRLLRTGAADAAEIEKTVEIIERNGRMQLQLIEDLLDSARIISGKLKLETQPVWLAGVITAALDVVRTAAQAKSIELVSNLEPLANQITGDPNRLQQIVWNLLSNAIKFTREGGRVELRMENADQHVRITVKDTGKGIEPEFLPFVFDRFRQSDSSSARRFGGLGLGLSLVKQLVELHGGTIEAASDGSDRGATFTVTLPQHAARSEAFIPQPPRAVAAREAQADDAIPRDEIPSLAGVRVLVVDDEEEARSLLTAVLGEAGAQVMAVSSGVEALAILADPPGGKRQDALILDINMPDEDGYQALERVRALEAELGVAPSARIPAIALTAMGRTEDRLKALAAGFRMHVVKPVEPGELIVVIASLVERLSAGRSG